MRYRLEASDGSSLAAPASPIWLREAGAQSSGAVQSCREKKARIALLPLVFNWPNRSRDGPARFGGSGDGHLAINTPPPSHSQGPASTFSARLLPRQERRPPASSDGRKRERKGKGTRGRKTHRKRVYNTVKGCSLKRKSGLPNGVLLFFPRSTLNNGVCPAIWRTRQGKRLTPARWWVRRPRRGGGILGASARWPGVRGTGVKKMISRVFVGPK